MARVRTVDLLPEIFRTDTNKKFLNATLDQLTANPQFDRVEGFVGRRIGAGINPNDGYVIEPNRDRTLYQLEPSVVFREPATKEITDAITYPEILDAVRLNGGKTNNHDRLFTSEYYSWDPLIDLDKFVNFNQYYWIPQGPDAVDVFGLEVPFTDSFLVDSTTQGVIINDIEITNPTITLARGGSYTFEPINNNQTFYIQTNPGASGLVDGQPNQSAREVLGITNNGAQQGALVFDVPDSTAQNFFFELADIGKVDLVTELPFNEINNKYLNDFLAKHDGIDEITDLNNRTLIFFDTQRTTKKLNYRYVKSKFDFDPYDQLMFDQEDEIVSSDTIVTEIDPDVFEPPRLSVITQVVMSAFDQEPWDSELYDRRVGANTTRAVPREIQPDDTWVNQSRYDSVGFDATTYAQEVAIDTKAQRLSIWKIELQGDVNNPLMTLVRVADIPVMSKFQVLMGREYNNLYFYKDREGNIKKVPLLTAFLDTLYYQDSLNPDNFGIIKIVDQDQSKFLDVDDDIIGKKEYISPNGVKFTNGLKIKFRGNSRPDQFEDQEYYIEGVGTAIELIPAADLITPEKYTNNSVLPFDNLRFDANNYEADTNAPKDPDYFTINRASIDGNPWSRSNRWFHIDVLSAAAKYNQFELELAQGARAQRPIIEYVKNIKLYNFGTESKGQVDIIDFVESDALTKVNGSDAYIVDGYTLISGSKIIFASDRDPRVSNKIYRVEFVDHDLSGQLKINLTEEPNGEILENHSVICLSGINTEGKTFYFSSGTWLSAQQKQKANQPPLFDVYDTNNHSFGDNLHYTSSNFTGSKLFSYSRSGAVKDQVLGINLKYQNINNIGDIVFENNLQKDTFAYVNGSTSQQRSIADGVVREYKSRQEFKIRNNWQKSQYPTTCRQIFVFDFQNQDLLLDIEVDSSAENAVELRIQGIYVPNEDYRVLTVNSATVIRFVDNLPDAGTAVEVSVISQQVSAVGYFEVPKNLEINAKNQDFSEITLGTIRNHYNELVQTIDRLQGQPMGRNNSRDLGNIVPYGNKIVKQSSPLTYAAMFMRSKTLNFISSLEFAGREYEKFKFNLLDTVYKNDFAGSARDILDQALVIMNSTRTSDSSYYWSDMIPCGGIYVENTFTVTDITTEIFDTVYTYDFSTANYRGLLVYANDQLLTKGTDYDVADDGPRLNLKFAPPVGTVITIREYLETYGNYVPPTPTKLGLYKKFKPEIYRDDSYVDPVNIIIGHDGSRTIAFDDIRDQVLMEFELRIYNNIKVLDQPALCYEDVAPGSFRSTQYQEQEIADILLTDFLTWTSWNRLDYKSQEYDADNAYTWNYNRSVSKLNNRKNLPGHWRAVFKYFYDTDLPHLRPWEMVGLVEEPSWWQQTYGPAPYTKGNWVLWDDLAEGKIADPSGVYYIEKFQRPQLRSVIPVDDEGRLLPPTEIMASQINLLDTERSWTFGDQGPVENVWRNSSAWPFAVQKLLALTKPAEYFALNIDRDQYRFNQELNQYVLNARLKLSPALIQVPGDGVAKHSYLNWIVDYARSRGLNGSQSLRDLLDQHDVQLSYRVSGFTDKKYLKIFTEKTSPNTNNSTLMLPDESYSVLLHQNEIFEYISYSSIQIQKVSDGYVISGNNKIRPYFEISQSILAGSYYEITAEGKTVRLSRDYTDQVTKIPYGFVFSTETAVCDFIISYGHRLSKLGFKFDQQLDGKLLNWNQMAVEFLSWSQQGWFEGAIISLNPCADVLEFERSQTVVAPFLGRNQDELLLNQNSEIIKLSQINIDRLDNFFRIQMLDGNSLGLANLRLTAYEHLIVIENKSIFNDLIYDPAVGTRQARLKLVGYVTSDWNGQVDIPGFILNQDNVREWQPGQQYNKGEIVKFKNKFYAAAETVQPSETFVLDRWLATEYNRITKGLLPNISTKSQQSKNYYDLDQVNLETDADLLGPGLIGFRSRDYFKNLNLTDITQVNLYKEFIARKGTPDSLELFQNATFDKELTDYEIYENWAIKASDYGASANRSFADIVLQQSQLRSNPSAVEIINPGEISAANQTVDFNSLYRASFKVTSKNLLPTTQVEKIDQSLPSAGFVNINDIDITVFDINADLTSINQDLNRVTTGAVIWIAKDSAYEWNVYRCTLIAPEVIEIRDNLDSRARVLFNGNHGLALGDIIIIKFFDDQINGAYRVREILDLDLILIDLVFEGDQDLVSGLGICFVLTSSRVSQPSDISRLTFANNILPGDRAWVDNANSENNWAVYEKINPFTHHTEVYQKQPRENVGYASSVAQSLDNVTLAVGSPGYLNNQGAVYLYFKKSQNSFVEDRIFSPQIQNLSSLGQAVAFGGNRYLAAGAPDSYNGQGYVLIFNNSSTAMALSQILVMPNGAGIDDDQFGHSLAISDNGQWLYVGAPGANKVLVYQLREIENQRLEYRGETIEALISDVITVDTAQQLNVRINGVLKTPIADYQLQTNSDLSKSIVFTEEPTADAVIVITRQMREQFVTDGSTVSFDCSSLYAAKNIYSILVKMESTILRPWIDYIYNAATQELTLTAVPAAEQQLTVSVNNYYHLVDSLTVAGLDPTARFGHSLSCTTDGRQVAVGAPLQSVNEFINGGQVYFYDRETIRTLVSQDNTNTVTVFSQVENSADVAVSVNNQILVNSGLYVNGSYDSSYDSVSQQLTVTVDQTLNAGDLIDIETSHFRLIGSSTLGNNNNTAEYGSSIKICSYNCSVYIGAPKDSAVAVDAGSVTRLINQARIYGTILGTTKNPTVQIDDTLRINDFLITFTGTDLDAVVADINAANIPNLIAKNANGYLLLQLIHLDAAPLGDKLRVLPGPRRTDLETSSALTDLGLDVYKTVQLITAPIIQPYSEFGHCLAVGSHATTLVVGVPKGTTLKPLVFDGSTTTYDSGSTAFIDEQAQSGAVYTYDLLPAANGSVTNPGQLVFGQQIYDTAVDPVDNFGFAVDYTSGILIVASPKNDEVRNEQDFENTGRLSLFYNLQQNSAWHVLRNETPMVDSALVNSISIYNRNDNKILSYLDYYDPLQGKILSAAKQNIDFVAPTDPAAYTQQLTFTGNIWGQDHVGLVWWDVSNCRFVNYYQEDQSNYSARRWGQLFPGSQVDVYQWVASLTPPAEYVGAGTVYDINRFSVETKINALGILQPTYYFWVRGTDSIGPQQGKTLTPQLISQYIENPRSSGIPFFAAVTPSKFVLVNATPYLSANDSVLHIEFDQIATDNNIHSEFYLIRDGDPNQWITAGLYKKLLDSFCGVDNLGNPVPDPKLLDSDAFGINFRPRQSMFANRFAALKNYIERANRILAQYPIVESKKLRLPFAQDHIPAAGLWDKQVSDLSELAYQNLSIVPQGYKYLVLNDQNHQGLWAIYQLDQNKSLKLIQVQTYNTLNYWKTVNWYVSGFDSTKRPTYEVAIAGDLSTLNVPLGTVVQVTNSAVGRWELYQLDSLGWQRVALENGTIQILPSIYDYARFGYGFGAESFDNQFYDHEPTIETRQIIRALNEEIFVDDLLAERKNLLILMFEYITAEQQTQSWLFKTSLVDVQHTVRKLDTYPVLRRDNQDFIQEYFAEVKPYHTKVKEFILRYTGLDDYQGNITDFDLPATYNSDQNKFLTPVLSDLGLQGTFDQNNDIWQTNLYNHWFNNFKLEVASVSIIDGGSGYTIPPVLTVEGECDIPARLIAKINRNRQISKVEVEFPGQGYTTTPTVTISGGNGQGGKLLIVTAPTAIRSVKTVIKYDRYQLSSDIYDWDETPGLELGSLRRYGNRVYRAKYSISTVEDLESSPIMHPRWEQVDPSELSGIDRTWGFYQPRDSEIGRDLSLLISGIAFPGVSVTAPGYDENTGYAVGSFDISPWDNIEIGPEGQPTYSQSLLDTAYESAFTDSYLGTRPEDITVSGGAYIDSYHSHAPEELVPGVCFDALNIKVYSRVGQDNTGQGHGFPIRSMVKVWQGDELYWGDLLKYPYGVDGYNFTTNVYLIEGIDFVVNWDRQTVTVDSEKVQSGQELRFVIYGIGGGNILHQENLLGNELTTDAATSADVLILPVSFDEIKEIAMQRNGTQLIVDQDFNLAPISSYQSRILFLNEINDSDRLVLTVLGAGNYSWSTPVKQLTIVTDSDQNSYPIELPMSGTNSAVLKVKVNGNCLRSPEGAYHRADGIVSIFQTSIVGGTGAGEILPNDILVFVNNVKQQYLVDYTLSEYNLLENFIWIIFNQPPAENSLIEIYCFTDAEFFITEGTVHIKPQKFKLTVGDALTFITYNDTAEQQIQLRTYQGPMTSGDVDRRVFDADDFDLVTFDQTVGTIIKQNLFSTGQPNPDRIILTINNIELFFGKDYTIEGEYVKIAGPIINDTDVVVIRTFSNTVVPEPLAFGIFKDMQDNQSVYRLPTLGVTKVISDLGDRIYVNSVEWLTEPNLEKNIFGIAMINGERIVYGERNLNQNYISRIRRGTAGTASVYRTDISAHPTGSIVYDYSAGNTVELDIKMETFQGNGAQTDFVLQYTPLNGRLQIWVNDEKLRPNSDYEIDVTDSKKINIYQNTTTSYVGSSVRNQSLILDRGDYTNENSYVTIDSIVVARNQYTIGNGILRFVNPVSASAVITVSKVPEYNSQIVVSYAIDRIWYSQGVSTASNGQALQTTNTVAAKFLRGL